MLNLERLSQALNKFRDMIDRNPREQEFQEFLQENYWMFGGEYSTLIPKRRLPYNRELDFAFARSVDTYLEIVEIKRPGAKLFEKAEFKKNGEYSFELHVEEDDLVRAIAQVDNYICNFDSQKYMIESEAKNRIKVERVAAKIVIGQNGNDDEMLSLRRLNGRLNRIEVITYDQLYELGRTIVEMLSGGNSIVAPA